MKRHLFLALFLTIATPWAASAAVFTLKVSPKMSPIRFIYATVTSRNGAEVTYLAQNIKLSPTNNTSQSINSGIKDNVIIEWEDGNFTYRKELALSKRDRIGLTGVFAIGNNGSYSQNVAYDRPEQPKSGTAPSV